MSDFSMMFWQSPREQQLEEISQQVYDILMLLHTFGPPFAQFYLTAYRQQEAAPFSLTFEAVLDLVRQTVGEERMQYSHRGTGAGLAFFTSRTEDESAVIRFSVGHSNPRLTNALVLQFPHTYSIYDRSQADRQALEALFCRCAAKFHAYYAFTDCDGTERGEAGYLHKFSAKPYMLHWMNYYNHGAVRAWGIPGRALWRKIRVRELVGGRLVVSHEGAFSALRE